MLSMIRQWIAEALPMSEKVCRTYVLGEEEEAACNCCGFELFPGDVIAPVRVILP